ncbi:MAG: outer membrane protein transport protein [Candidatus Cloacimonadaceae bacterium]|nr:outer membrane protein transport protein [Candidatus Cloacimonadaceae bacterium]
MNKLRMALLLTILIGISVGLFAGGFALSGIGSRAQSMGGAFRGMADDPSSIYWNPAGMAYLDGNQISLAGSVFYPTSKWENTATLPGYGNDELTAVKKLRAFPGFFGLMNKNPDAVLGLGIFVPYGLGATWDAYDLPTSGQPPGSTLLWSEGFPEEEMMSSIGIIDFRPSLAYKFNDMFSIGAGFSVLYGMIDLAKIVPHSTLSYYAPTTFDMSGSGMGYGANLGVMVKPIENLSIGLTGKLPVDMKLQGTAEIRLWLNQFANYSVWGGNNPAFFVPNTYGGDSDIEATLKLPGEAAIGFSYKVMPNWAVNLDYSYTTWNRLDTVTVKMKENITILQGHPTMQTVISERDLAFKWKDTHRVSLGSEYVHGCNNFRAGFFFDQSPVPDETFIPTLPDINNKFSSNAGYGHALGNWTLDLNYQFVMFPERKITVQTADNMVGIYNSHVHSGNIGISYKF